MFRRGTIHFAVACALVAPPAATAQEPVQLDPDSPAGVEYQLPLDQARRDAAPDAGGGGPRSDGGSGGPAPLFGAGIAPDGSQDGGGGGDAAADDRDATADDRKRGVGEQSRGSDDSAPGAGGGDPAGPGAGQSASSFSATADGGGASNGLTLGGIALAVVVVGGTLGLALRRGLRTTTS
ncbi:MAG: hypothetical protein WKF96_22090 [Solirubrobacteraceae bacterium]